MAILEELNNYLTKYNSYLISEEPKNWDSKVKIKCNDCGTDFSISVKQLLRPHPERTYDTACPLCTTKLKFLYMLEKKYGQNPYTFLSDFKGYEKPLKVKCNDCGYEWMANKARNLLSNASLTPGHHPCKECANREYKKKEKTESIEDFKNLLISKFGSCDYDFPNPEEFRYRHQGSKIHIKCKKCGHEMYTYHSNILNPKNNKHYCRVCNKKDRLLEAMTYAERCKMVTSGKIEPIEDYIDSRTPILHKCNICGHIWKKIPVKNTTRCAGCPKCKNKITVSKAETEVLEYIKSIYSGKVVTKDRKILNGKEIDIYLPDLKLGFEIDGLYYHCTDYKSKEYHLNKQLAAQEKGVTLIHIFDSFWYHGEKFMKGENLVNIEKAMKEQIDIDEHINSFEIEAISEKELKDIGVIDGISGKCYYVDDELISIIYKNIAESYNYIQYHYSPDVLKLAINDIKGLRRTIQLDRRYNTKESNICKNIGLLLEKEISPLKEYFDSNSSAVNATLTLKKTKRL